MSIDEPYIENLIGPSSSGYSGEGGVEGPLLAAIENLIASGETSFLKNIEVAQSLLPKREPNEEDWALQKIFLQAAELEQVDEEAAESYRNDKAFLVEKTFKEHADELVPLREELLARLDLRGSEWHERRFGTGFATEPRVERW